MDTNLPEDKRTQLDGIVKQMVRNRESDGNIRFVVDDFKKKYTAVKPIVAPPVKKQTGDPLNPGTGLFTPEQIGNATGGTKIAQGIGQGLVQGQNTKLLNETQKSQMDIQGQLLQRIKDKKAKGEDTARLDHALTLLNEDISQTGKGAEQTLNPEGLTGKQVAGDALQLATTAVGGEVTSGIANKVGTGVGVAKGIAKGALSGGLSGTALGASEGAAQGLKKDESGAEILKSAESGALAGGLGGAVIGGIAGGFSGKAQAEKYTTDLIDNHIASAKTELTNLPEKEIKRLGGEQRLFEQNKKDIIDQLRADGLNAQADKIQKISVSKGMDIDSYETAIRDSLKAPTKADSFVKDLVAPKETAKVKEEALAQGRVTEPGLLSKSKILPGKREGQLAEVAKDYVSSKAPITQNIDSVKNGISDINTGVKDYVRANKVPFNTNQLKSQLNQGKDDLNLIFASDAQAEKTYNAVSDEFMKHVKNMDTAGLLDARQSFDKIPAIKKLLDSQGLGENTKKEVVLTVRDMANKYIAKLLPAGNEYRTKLLTESKLIEALGNMAEKNIGMIGQNKLQMLVTEYPILKWVVSGLVGAGGVGVGGAIIGSTD